MLIRLDMRSDKPIYTQIEDSIRVQIGDGALVGGDRLPSARSLAESLDVNMHTVLKAYAGLEHDGLIEMRRGRGGVVVLDVPELETLLKAVVETARREGMGKDELVDLIEEMWT